MVFSVFHGEIPVMVHHGDSLSANVTLELGHDLNIIRNDLNMIEKRVDGT